MFFCRKNVLGSISGRDRFSNDTVFGKPKVGRFSELSGEKMKRKTPLRCTASGGLFAIFKFDDTAYIKRGIKSGERNGLFSASGPVASSRPCADLCGRRVFGRNDRPWGREVRGRSFFRSGFFFRRQRFGGGDRRLPGPAQRSERRPIFGGLPRRLRGSGAFADVLTNPLFFRYFRSSFRPAPTRFTAVVIALFLDALLLGVSTSAFFEGF